MIRVLAASALVVLVAGCGPVWRIPGGRLFGEVVTEPVDDWSFTHDVTTVALETRPRFPHSVTVVCFTHGPDLYVPSLRPATKRWPEYVRQNPAVRLQIEGKLYPGRLTRVNRGDEEWRVVLGSLAARFGPIAPPPGDARLPDVIFFRFEQA